MTVPVQPRLSYGTRLRQYGRGERNASLLFVITSCFGFLACGCEAEFTALPLCGVGATAAACEGVNGGATASGGTTTQGGTAAKVVAGAYSGSGSTGGTADGGNEGRGGASSRAGGGVASIGTGGAAVSALGGASPASCSDGARGGAESDLDCGGSCGASCELLEHCFSGGDCVSGACAQNLCAPELATGVLVATEKLSANASHTYDGQTPPRFAVDGDPETCWASGVGQVPGMWFLVDLAEPQFFFDVELVTNAESNDYARKLRISASVDGTTFDELRTNIWGERELKITFARAQYARYLKLELLEPTGGLWWRIDELNVRR